MTKKIKLVNQPAHQTVRASRTQTMRFYLSTFTGKEWCKSQWLAQRGPERGISETGFSYFGARYYDSDLSGLFLSVDPMADKYSSINPYNYCFWNPIKLIDPNGLDTIYSFACNTSNLNYNRRNMNLLKSMRNLGDNPNIIVVAMHGSKNNNTVDCPITSSGNETKPITAEQFAQKIRNGSYGSYRYNENQKNGKKTLIILLSCYTGRGDDSFGKQLSKQLESAIVIAPVGAVWAGINNQGETTITNNEAILIGDGKYKKGEPRRWGVFYNGKRVMSFRNNNLLLSIIKQCGVDNNLD